MQWNPVVPPALSGRDIIRFFTDDIALYTVELGYNEHSRPSKNVCYNRDSL